MPIPPKEVLAHYKRVKAKRFREDVKVQFSLIDIQPAKLEPSMIQAAKGETREDAARRIANDLLKRIREGEALSELAKKHSHGPYGFRGGQWPPRSPDSLVPPWDRLAARSLQMQPGDVSEPIVLKDGRIFLLELNQIHRKKGQSFAEVKDILEEELRKRKRTKLEAGHLILQQGSFKGRR